MTQTSAAHTHTQPSGSYLLFCLRNCGLCVCVCGGGGGGCAPETKTVLQLHSSSCVQAYIYKCVYVCFHSMTDLSAVHKHISSSSSGGVWRRRLRTHTANSRKCVYACVWLFQRIWKHVCVCVCARVHARGINLSLWWGCCSERGVLLIQLSLIMSTRPLSTLTTQYTHNELRRLCVCTFVCKRESHTNTFN